MIESTIENVVSLQTQLSSWFTRSGREFVTSSDGVTDSSSPEDVEEEFVESPVRSRGVSGVSLNSVYDVSGSVEFSIPGKESSNISPERADISSNSSSYFSPEDVETIHPANESLASTGPYPLNSSFSTFDRDSLKSQPKNSSSSSLESVYNASEFNLASSMSSESKVGVAPLDLEPVSPEFGLRKVISPTNSCYQAAASDHKAQGHRSIELSANDISSRSRAFSDRTQTSQSREQPLQGRERASSHRPPSGSRNSNTNRNSKRLSIERESSMRPRIDSLNLSSAESPSKSISSANSSFRMPTPQAREIVSLTESFYQQPEHLPVFADVLVPVQLGSNSHQEVIGAYTVDRGNVFVSVAAPMPITEREIIEQRIRCSELRLQQEAENLKKKNLMSTINRRLFGESVQPSLQQQLSLIDPNELAAGGRGASATSAEETSNRSIDSEMVPGDKKFRRRDLLFFVIEADDVDERNAATRESTYHVTISIRQPKLSKSTKSPQGSRSDTMVYHGLKSRMHAIRFAEATAPPVWHDSNKFCHLCSHSFALLRKGKHCRNCGQMICYECSSKCWPSSMLPATFHNNEKIVRICDSCIYVADAFAEALREGDLMRAKLVYSTGNVNTRCPFTSPGSSESAHPVHMAAYGGDLEVLKWLLEELLCPLYEDSSVTIATGEVVDAQPLVTSTGLTCFGIAAKQGNVEMMEYLASQHGAKVTEVSDIRVLWTALHAALDIPGDPPSLPGPGFAGSISRWLGGAMSSISMTSSPETVPLSANLITGNPDAGFFVTADVAAVIPQYHLNRPTPSTAAGARSPEQRQRSATPETTPNSSGRLNQQQLNAQQSTKKNARAVAMVENEILRIAQIHHPELGAQLQNQAHGTAAITLPYSDHDVMDFHDYTLGQLPSRRRRLSSSSTGSQGNASHAAPAQETSSYVAPRYQGQTRRTVRGSANEAPSVYGPSNFGRRAATPTAPALRTTSRSTPDGPPGAVHLVPRNRSNPGPTHSNQQQQQAQALDRGANQGDASRPPQPPQQQQGQRQGQSHPHPHAQQPTPSQAH
jgi:hypothetical protein